MKKIKEFNNIKEIIYNSKEKFGDSIAFTIKESIDNEKIYKNITYKKMLEDINNFGSYLYKCNLQESRIAIVGRNRYEWVISHLTNLLGGIVSIPLDKDLQIQELESSLIRSKAEVIIFDEKYLKNIEEIKRNNKTSIKKYICMSNINNNDYEFLYDDINLGSEIIKENTSYIDHKIDPDKMNILLFTSGTTSKSKAVMLSHKNIASNIYAILSCEDIRNTDTNIALLPFHHIFGSTCMLIMLAYGVKTVFPDGLRYLKQNFIEYKVSIFVGVPLLVESIYKTIMKAVEKQNKTKLLNTMIKISNFLLKFKIDLRRVFFKSILDALGGKIRFVISGGAPADPDFAKGFNDLGIQTVQGYGLTETSPVIAAEDKKHIRKGSVGKPMINDEIKIVNKDSNGIGEIIVKGPNIMLGYYEMEEETNKVLKDGYFYTGDLGYIDKDGYLFITGRNKNVIVLKNGKKVFPEELETLVNKIDLISESMVYGMPSKDDINDVTLSVKIVRDQEVIKEKYSNLSDDEINILIWDKIKQLNTKFPRYKHIQNKIITDTELIKTTTKKVKRQEEMKLILNS